MSRSPGEHFRIADALLAEVSQADPAMATKLPFVQFKLQRAKVHALLAQVPPDRVPVTISPTGQYDAQTAAECIAAQQDIAANPDYL